METKVCRYCKEEKLISEFGIANITNGIQYRRQKCKICKQKTAKARLYKIKLWIIEIKKTKECIICGEHDFRVLDFHHVRGEKKFEIGEAMRSGSSKKRILKEIKKCDVLCCKCHRISHWKQNNLV